MTFPVGKLLLQKRIWQLSMPRARFVSARCLHQPVADAEVCHQLENAIEGAVWASAGEMIVADMRFTRDSFDYWFKAPIPSSTTLKALASTWAKAHPCTTVPFEFWEKTMGKKIEDFLQRLVANIEQKKAHALQNRKVHVKLVDEQKKAKELMERDWMNVQKVEVVNEEGDSLQEEKGSIGMELVGIVREKGEALQHEAKQKEEGAAEDEARHVVKKAGITEDEYWCTNVEMQILGKEVPAKVQAMKEESELQHVAKEVAKADTDVLHTQVEPQQGEKKGLEIEELQGEVKPVECKYVEEDMAEIDEATLLEAEKGKGEAQSIGKHTEEQGAKLVGDEHKVDVTSLEKILNDEPTLVEKDSTGKEVVMEIVAEKEEAEWVCAAEVAKGAAEALEILKGECDKKQEGMGEKDDDRVANLVEKQRRKIKEASEVHKAQGEERKIVNEAGKVEAEVKAARKKDEVDAMDKRKEGMKGKGKWSLTEPLVESLVQAKQAEKHKEEDAHKGSRDEGRYTNAKPLHVELEHKDKLNIVQIRKKKASGRVHI